MKLIKLLIIINTKLIFGKLVGEYTMKESIEGKGFLLFGKNFQDMVKVSIQDSELRILRECEISDCQECKNNTCISCTKGYVKKGNYCFSNDQIDINVLLGIIIGSVTFIILFCFVY